MGAGGGPCTFGPPHCQKVRGVRTSGPRKITATAHRAHTGTHRHAKFCTFAKCRIKSTNSVKEMNACYRAQLQKLFKCYRISRSQRDRKSKHNQSAEVNTTRLPTDRQHGNHWHCQLGAQKHARPPSTSNCLIFQFNSEPPHKL